MRWKASEGIERRPATAGVWFAWYPVKAYWDADTLYTAPQWVWLERVRWEIYRYSPLLGLASYHYYLLDKNPKQEAA